jgi:hypothetical protein
MTTDIKTGKNSDKNTIKQAIEKNDLKMFITELGKIVDFETNFIEACKEDDIETVKLISHLVDKKTLIIGYRISIELMYKDIIKFIMKYHADELTTEVKNEIVNEIIAYDNVESQSDNVIAFLLKHKYGTAEDIFLKACKEGAVTVIEGFEGIKLADEVVLKGKTLAADNDDIVELIDMIEKVM